MNPTPSSYSQAQIDQLAESMRAGFGEIKTMLQALDERVRCIEKNEAGTFPIVNSKLDAAWREIDVLKTKADDRLTRLAELEHKVRVLEKALLWVGTGAGAAVMGLLWQILTGQVHITP
jgi:hypothetical protein